MKYIKQATLVENDRSKHLPLLLRILNMKTFSLTLIFKDRQASNLNTKTIQPRQNIQKVSDEDMSAEGLS
jgi:hypothetical protein